MGLVLWLLQHIDNGEARVAVLQESFVVTDDDLDNEFRWNRWVAALRERGLRAGEDPVDETEDGELVYRLYPLDETAEAVA